MRYTNALAGLGLAIFISWSGAASPGREGPVFSIIEENDLVVDSDRNYTQGIKLSYFHEDGYLPWGSVWLHKHLPKFGLEIEAGKFGYSVGQNIYTPADLTVATLQPLDRPYAGWLYVGAMLERRGRMSSGLWAAEQYGIQAGVIGPWSLAKEAQTWVHEIRDYVIPLGWDHQLRNEPGLRLTYWRTVRWPVAQHGNFSVDFWPHGGLSLGNVETSARIGGRLRAGFHLPENFGPQTIDALATTTGGRTACGSRSWSAQLFAGVEGRYLARSAFLDGNLFRNSHHVQSHPWGGDAQFGAALAWRRAEVGYIHTFRLPEFPAQTQHHSFGSVYFKWMF